MRENADMNDISLNTQVLPISGMHCTGCAGTVERALAAVPGVRGVRVDLAANEARVEFSPEQAGLTAFAEALTRAGYGIATRGVDVIGASPGAAVRLAAIAGVLSVRPDPAGEVLRVEAMPELRDVVLLEAAGAGARLMGSASPAERRDRMVLVVCAVLAVPFLAEMAAHLSGLHGFLPLWLQFALALPVWAVGGARFHLGAWRSVVQRAPGMDLLVSIGTTAAFALSVWNWFAGGHVWFEAAVLVIVLLRAGKALEAAARRRAADAASALLRLTPDMADRVLEDGSTETVPAMQLAVGDRVRIAPGAALPADGEVIEGQSAVDESLVTGEALPVAKTPGASVLAGSVNGPGSLVVTVRQTAGDTLVARIAADVRKAQAARAPAQALADRVSGWFVPAVLAIAALTFAGNLLLGAGIDAAVLRAVSVLVVACPCALGIATPLALAAGLGALAQRGVLVRDPAALENLRRIATVAFDKTGTLTRGAPRVIATFGEEKALGIAASLSVGGRHPLSAGIMQAATQEKLTPRPAMRLVAVPGQGVTGSVTAKNYALGNAALMAAQGAAIPEEFLQQADAASAQSGTPVYLARDDQVIALFLLADDLRDGARDAIQALRDENVRTVILSGDTQKVADHVGVALRVHEARGGLKPDQKVATLRALPGPVAFVGDGINDAPALAAADLGIAMAGGTDAALAAAPVALLRPQPELVPVAIGLARSTALTMRVNLALAFGFNALAIPAAALGYLSPVVAAVAMMASSLAVTLNALGLRYRG